MLHTRRRIKRLYHKAAGLVEQEKYDDAWPYITEMMSLDMDGVAGLYLCGVFMRKRGHTGLAAQLFRRCVSLDPKKDNLWVHFAACLHDIHQYDAAAKIWEMLLKRTPTDSSVLRNAAGTYLQQGKFHDALNTINQSIELVKDVPPAYLVIKSFAALGLERWKEGFDNYHGLFGDQMVTRKYRDPEEPDWDGSAGQTVVIQGDQGLGDEIRFASILGEAARDCKRVIFDCHPKLENVMRRSFPQVQVYGTRKYKVADWVDNEKIDASCHISGLGKLYRHKNEDFPRTPYLIPDEAKVSEWKEKLKDLPKPWVGIAWTGGHYVTRREERSFDLATFMPLLQEEGSFIDLSYHDSKPELEYFNERSEHKVIRFEIDQNDYDNTLALVAALDLVVCVPTTIFHAAGAIGKPCFVFNPSFPQWEFGKRDDVIWYSTVRVFRGQIEDVRDAYLHWCGQPTTDCLHGFAKLDHPKGIEAGSDNTPRIAAATYW